MTRRYEDLKSPRFVVDRVDGAEIILIRARRDWFIICFLGFWLVGWTFGGVTAVVALSTQFQPFLVAWLLGWAAGWLMAACILLWQVAGMEYLRPAGGDLEVGYSFPGFTRARLYRGADIRSLRAAASGDIFGRMNAAVPPFLNWGPTGSIKFNYGARTIRAAAALDEAEGQMIVEHLRKRLPASAVEPSSL